MRAETWEVCTLGLYVFVGRVVSMQNREEEVWMSSSCAPYQVLRQDSLVHCEGRTILEVLFISAFSSSFCFPRKKKSQNPSSISLPIDSRGWLRPHTERILPPMAVDTSFCVPFNQLITISHNPPSPPLCCFHYPHYRYYRYVLFKGTFLSILHVWFGLKKLSIQD